MATRTLLGAILAAALAGTTLPAAAVVVDSFTTNQATLMAPPGGASVATTAGADIIGLHRGLVPELLSGAGPVTVSVSGGALTFTVMNTTPDSRGEARVTWDGDNNPNNLAATGLGGQDLTGGGHSSFRAVVNAASAGTELVLTVYTDAANVSRAAVRLPAIAAPTNVYFSYSSDFATVTGAGADFTNVGAIVLTVRGTETSTFSLDLLDTAAPAVGATKRDLDLANMPIAAPIPPGSSFKYRITITNTGGQAETVNLADTLDANTSLTAIDATPVVVNDAYETFGNVARSIPAGSGLLANDTEPDNAGAPPALVVDTTPSPVTTTLGGTATLNADGSFSYVPPLGVGRAVDTFSYTAVDNEGNTAAGQVKILLKDRVWFVDDTHPGANLGTLADPFTSITAANLNGGGGSGDLDQPGDIIFLFQGSGTYTTGLQLENGQQLIGHGTGLTLDGEVLVAVGTAPTLTNAGGPGVTLAQDNTLRGFNIGNTMGAGILGNAFVTLNLDSLSISGSGPALDLTNGAVQATFGNIASTSSARAIDLDAVTGTLTVSGSTTVSNATDTAIVVTNGGSSYDFGTTTITASASGVNLSASPTATTHFTSLNVTATAGSALVASNAGTLDVDGASNALTATGGSALDLMSTSLATGSNAFTTLSATTTGTRPGVRLSSVAGPGSLSGGAVTVNGTGAGQPGVQIAGSAAVTSFSSGTVSSTGGDGIQLSGANGAVTFTTVAINGTGGQGIAVSGNTNPVTISGGTIGNTTTTTGNAIDIDTGSANVTIAASVTNSSQRSVEVTGRAGGTVSLTGNLSDTSPGTGIRIASNTSGTIQLSGTTKSIQTGANPAVTLATNGTANINFTGGGLALQTTSGAGFSASGGAGGITVTGGSNTITSTTGTALSVVSSNIGASGLTFQSISSNGGTNGIVLSSTGASGGLTVTGTGSAGSGGTIQNKAIGISLTSTQGISLSWMQLNDHSDFAIRGSSVDGFTLANTVISGVNGNDAAADEGSVRFTGLTGTASVTSCNISGGFEDNFKVVNSSGTLNRLTFSNTTIGANSTTDGNDGIGLESTGSSTVMNVTVQNSFFTSARGDLFQLNVIGNSTADLIFTGNALSNNHPAIATGGGGVTISGGDNTGTGANLTMNMSGNTFRDSDGHAILFVKSTDPGTFRGTFNNNQIGVAATADSGSKAGSGIKIQNAGLGAVTVAVTSNQIRQYNNFGIEMVTGGGATALSGALNATITGNTISNPGTSGFPMNGVHLNGGTVPGDTYQICTDIGGGGALANSILGSGANGGTDFRLRQRQATTVRLPGYGGANNNDAAVVTFVQGRNTSSPSGLSSNTVPTGGGFVGGAACPAP